MREWYVYAEGKQVGPFSTADAVHFARRKGLANVHVWTEGFRDWRLADVVPEFAEDDQATRTISETRPALSSTVAVKRKSRWARNGAMIALAITLLRIVAGSESANLAFRLGEFVGAGIIGALIGFAVGALVDWTAKPSLAPKVDQQGRKANFIARHWKGELPLWVSYWAIGFLSNLLIAFVALIVGSLTNASGGFHPTKIFILIAFLWLSIGMVCTWQLVGVLRSASSYSQARRFANRSAFWGIAAQIVAVVALFGNVSLFIKEAIPQIAETYRMAFEDDPSIPSYSIRVMRDGTEAEISGGIKFGLTDDFRKVLDASRQIKVVHLDSIGGRIGEGERLFDLIRSRGLSTYVAAKCYSACTLAFVGGRERYISPKGQLGFHRGAFAGEEDVDGDKQREIFRRAGIADGFISTALSTPNKEMLKPSLDELRNARVVTAVARSDMFAYSGLGGHIDRDQVTLVFAKASPTFRALQDRHPSRYEAFVGQYVASVNKGKSEAETIVELRAQLLPFIQSLLPHAADDVLVRYNALMIDQMSALLAKNATLCYRFAAGETPGEIVGHFPEHLRSREQELQEQVIRTSSFRSPISEVESERLYKVVARRLTARGVSLDLILQTSIPTSKHADYCKAAIEFQREINNLSTREQSALLGHIWSQK